MVSFKEYVAKLEAKIINSYQQGVTTEDAEKLAGEFLAAQLQVSSELTKVDLDSRMRKTGLKALKASVYLDSVSKSDKKPSDTMLEQIVNSDEMVTKEQHAFDTAEVSHNELDRIYSVLKEAHIHFRTIAKGAFNG